jgi:hypothetical protein
MTMTTEEILAAVSTGYTIVCVLAYVLPVPIEPGWYEVVHGIIRRLAAIAPRGSKSKLTMPGRDPLPKFRGMSALLAVVLAGAAAMTGCGAQQDGRTVAQALAPSVADVTADVTVLVLRSVPIADDERAERVEVAIRTLDSPHFRQAFRTLVEAAADPGRFRDCGLMSHIDEAASIVNGAVNAVALAGVDVPHLMTTVVTMASVGAQWYAEECVR